jgi:hypothetical protein
MSCKKFEIRQIANELATKIQRLTLELLPAFETYEESSRIRHSSKFAKTISDETADHPENFWEQLGKGINACTTGI